MRPLILVSRADTASLTIRDALLDAGGWEDAGSFHGLPVRKHGEFLMAEVEPLHIECELVDRSLHAAGLAFDTCRDDAHVVSMRGSRKPYVRSASRLARITTTAMTRNATSSTG